MNAYRGGLIVTNLNPISPQLDVIRPPGASNACEVAIFGTGSGSLENEAAAALNAELGGPAGSLARMYPKKKFPEQIAYQNVGIVDGVPSSEFGTADGFIKNHVDYLEAVRQNVQLARQVYIGAPTAKPGMRTANIKDDGTYVGPAAAKESLLKLMELQKSLQLSSYNTSIQNNYRTDRTHAMALYQCRTPSAKGQNPLDATICPDPGAGAVTNSQVLQSIPGCENATSSEDCERTLQLKWFGGVDMTQQTMADKSRGIAATNLAATGGSGSGIRRPTGIYDQGAAV